MNRSDDNSHIIDLLGRIIPKERILGEELWREVYARDASYFNLKPQAIVRPSSVEEVAAILALARNSGMGVTFRAGGTSLSGQSVNTGIICELRTQWQKAQVRDNGSKIWFEPGLTARQVNRILQPYNTHIGPDPASSSAAMMGGILGNNSSGMSAGVRHNSYHTLSSIQFMLANGHRYDSASPADRKRFAESERELCDGLMNIRARLLASPELSDKISRKYKIKNVTGYAMNALLDFEDPIDIFSHLLIGSEGTLAYIISGELNTIPSMSTYSSTMLYFDNVVNAAASAAWLGESGAIAVEMMDYASLVSSLGLSAKMPAGTTAMLIDYGASSPDEIAAIISSLEPNLRKLKGLTRMDPFTRSVDARARLWEIRDGVFPCVAGARIPGSAVILEDVVAPVEKLDSLVEGVWKLFDSHNYHGAIFGHARDGNIHPLVTADMSSAKELDNFRSFMDGFVDHVLSLDGSLKGEHGTGRAIAPFVEREWGPEIFSMMKEIKHLADPLGILNPGVIINDDPDCFIHPIKSMDLFGDPLGYDRADKCMECGYCEHVCPSRSVTFTPRQRLQALRVISRTGSKELRRQFRYLGNQTCCTDGSCQMQCPMGINTATVTDAVRARTNPPLMESALKLSANHYGAVESTVRTLLRAAVASGKVISPYPLIWATDFLHRLSSQVPHWSRHFPMPARLHWQEVEDPQYIYFPACVTRIFGGSSLGKDDMITVMLRIASRAGLRVSLPRSVHGLCCSQIWEHKGDPEGQRIAAAKTVEEFYRLSDSGRIPIICDTTSCTHTLLTLAHNSNLLSDELLAKYKALTIIDITSWLLEHVMPRLTVTAPKNRILLHPTCASRLTGLDKAMEQVARMCAREVIIPTEAHCCGAAGDRGFIFPEVARGATRDERREISMLNTDFDGCYSLARTCEISMMDSIGHPYESLVYLIDETTTP